MSPSPPAKWREGLTKELFLTKLAENGGNINKTCALLGIPRGSIVLVRAEFGLKKRAKKKIVRTPEWLRDLEDYGGAE